MKQYVIIKADYARDEISIASNEETDRALVENQLLHLSKKNRDDQVTYYLFEAVAKGIKHQTNGLHYVEPVTE